MSKNTKQRSRNTKQRSREITAAALAVLEERGIDDLDTASAAAAVRERTGCALHIARKHVERAMRGETTEHQRGGSRPLSGRPKQNLRISLEHARVLQSLCRLYLTDITAERYVERLIEEAWEEADQGFQEAADG
jgi:hypothetical protein